MFTQDMRLDLPRIELLKSYPISGERLVAAEIAGPLTFVAAVELMLSVAAIIFHTAELPVKLISENLGREKPMTMLDMMLAAGYEESTARQQSTILVGIRERFAAGRRATASQRYRSSADLLGERDEDALRATDITEPIAVLVLHQLANQLGTVDAEPGDDIIDVFDVKHDATIEPPI